MDLGIEGRVALVTGASKGLAFAVAAELAREGARVAISSRSAERIEAAAAGIGAHGFVHDAHDVEAGPDLVRRVEAKLGPVDILVTSSGGPPAFPDSLAAPLEAWR